MFAEWLLLIYFGISLSFYLHLISEVCFSYRNVSDDPPVEYAAAVVGFSWPIIVVASPIALAICYAHEKSRSYRNAPTTPANKGPRDLRQKEVVWEEA